MSSGGRTRSSRVENPRPWLILNNDTHPFDEEEYMTVTLTTTPHDEGIPLEDADKTRRERGNVVTICKPDNC